MAVYTSITKETLRLFLNNYNIGSLLNFEGIIDGVENTNYKITTTNNIYILTIFEKRVKENELPFFIELQNHLSKKNIKCPEPIANQNGQYINTIKNKTCVIMSFLEGKKIVSITPDHCYQVGKELAKIHHHTKDFSLTRKNGLHQSHWRGLFDKCRKALSSIDIIPKKHLSYRYDNGEKTYKDLFKTIQKEINYLEKNWPINLPEGVIHADVFQDNVFFIQNTLSGLIDFYFACNDFYAYELAICINAWCFDREITFNKSKYKSLLNGYQHLRKLTLKELENLPILLRGAAMRFLLTRLHDQLYHSEEALVTPKNPIEFFEILDFHQTYQINNKNYGH